MFSPQAIREITEIAAMLRELLYSGGVVLKIITSAANNIRQWAESRTMTNYLLKGCQSLEIGVAPI